MQVFEAILNMLFPSRCLVCRGVVASDMPLCEKCAAERKVLHRSFDVDGERLDCFAPMIYDNGFRKSFHRFKFEGKKYLGKPMARLIFELVKEKSITADVITFVPMTAEQKRHRGYNQSEVIAKELSRLMGVELCEVLAKLRQNEVQSTLGAEARSENVKGVFSAEALDGERVLLVDDLVTTGATLCACTKVLKGAGAGEIVAVCAASASTRGFE